MVSSYLIAPLTDRQLRAELSRLDGEPADALESEQLEFKEWPPGSEQVRKQLRQLREAVVAFANAGGSHIVLGVRDRKRTRADAIQGLGQLDTRDLQKNICDGTDPHILVEISELLEPEGRLYASCSPPTSEADGHVQPRPPRTAPAAVRVPETAVPEDRFPPGQKHEVRRPRQRAAVRPEPEACPGQLRRGVLSANALAPVALFALLGGWLEPPGGRSAVSAWRPGTG